MRALEGIRVVELATYVAAPSGGRVLADWGAEVIKVESPKMDIWRNYGKTFAGPANDDENPVFDVPNANKKNLCMDLKNPEAMKAFHKLLATADVFITNNRPKPLKRMGLDYESLKAKYPRLVCGYVTGYGEEGPDADAPGFDTVAYWAKSGFMADMRIDGPGSYPIYAPGGVGDNSCGTMMAGGIAAALFAREKTGRGDKVSVSLFGLATWVMSLMNTTVQPPFSYKYPKTRFEGRPITIPYECADGEWIMINIMEWERYRDAFFAALDIPEVGDDPRFHTAAELGKLENREPLVKILEEAFRKFPSDVIDQRLTKADVVHSKLAHFRDAVVSEQAKANHYVEHITCPSGQDYWLARPCVQLEEAGLPPYELAHALGQDTRDILSGLGYAPEEIDGLVEKGAVKAK